MGPAAETVAWASAASNGRCSLQLVQGIARSCLQPTRPGTLAAHPRATSNADFRAPAGHGPRHNGEDLGDGTTERVGATRATSLASGSRVSAPFPDGVGDGDESIKYVMLALWRDRKGVGCCESLRHVKRGLLDNASGTPG